MRANVLLVDFENVQPADVGLLKDGPFKVKIFLGSNQAKVPVSLAVALQSLGSNAEYVVLESVGKNALDFHIAYYLGLLSSEDKSAYFHIISRDTGFDPLVKYLKGRKILISRSACIADIAYFKSVAPASVVAFSPAIDIVACAPLEAPATAPKVVRAPPQVQPSPSPASDIHIRLAIADLTKRKSSKPRTEKTLVSTLLAVFKKELSEKQVVKLVATLKNRGVVKIDGAKVAYNLSHES